MTNPAPANLLLVDDTPANLQILASMLRERGYRIRPVTSGEQALKAVEAESPDLVLLDITMPGMATKSAAVSKRTLVGAMCRCCSSAR